MNSKAKQALYGFVLFVLAMFAGYTTAAPKEIIFLFGVFTPVLGAVLIWVGSWPEKAGGCALVAYFLFGVASWYSRLRTAPDYLRDNQQLQQANNLLQKYFWSTSAAYSENGRHIGEIADSVAGFVGIVGFIVLVLVAVRRMDKRGKLSNAN